MADKRMKKRLTNTDAFEILNGRVRIPRYGPKASLSALQWEADKAGQSYGLFTQRLTPEDEAKIQREYEAQRDGDDGIN